MDTTARTTPIREVDLGDQAAFTDSRALTETLAAPQGRAVAWCEGDAR